MTLDIDRNGEGTTVGNKAEEAELEVEMSILMVASCTVLAASRIKAYLCGLAVQRQARRPLCCRKQFGLSGKRSLFLRCSRVSTKQEFAFRDAFTYRLVGSQRI